MFSSLLTTVVILHWMCHYYDVNVISARVCDAFDAINGVITISLMIIKDNDHHLMMMT